MTTTTWRTKELVAACLAAVAALAVGGARAGEIDPQLQARLATLAPTDEVAVIAQLRERPNLASFAGQPRRLRLRSLVTILRIIAARGLPALDTHLQSIGGRERKQLWAINALAVKLPASRVAALAQRPGVASVRLDGLMSAPDVGTGSPAPAEWNLGAVRATEMWALGFTGNGVVVANMDTGVDLQHPDLLSRYRGGTNSWFDPHGEFAAPYDLHGHGTQTMGLMVGGSVGGTAVGMAPDARWIAFRQYNSAGNATMSQIHQGFQWLLDPDNDANTDDAPHVVNASWGFAGTGNQCITEFEADIGLLKTAGIAVVFAAGNDGPAPGTSVSPANNANGFAVGSVDASQTVAYSSSRGPSSCNGPVFPTVAAPGVNVLTTDLSFGGFPFYAIVSGSSYATPHSAGAMALLVGAVPGASVSELEAALRDSAIDRGDPGPDDSYGFGLVDVRAAYDLLAGGTPNDPPQITSTPTTVAAVGAQYSYAVSATDAQGDALTYALTQAPAGMTIGPANGLVLWTPNAAQAGSHAVTVRVTDSPGLSDSQAFTIAVAAVNVPPTAANDAYQTVQQATLSVAAPGVLANDSDADGNPLTALLVSGPASGTLSLNADGSFTYVPVASFVGTSSFQYLAQDPSAASSAAATVSITVLANRPPVAANDNFGVPRRLVNSYPAQLLPVLANDSDPDTPLDPANNVSAATLTIVTGPNNGGTASAIRTGASAGNLSYKPRKGFVGTETITYRVKDTRGKNSNTATVTITVN